MLWSSIKWSMTDLFSGMMIGLVTGILGSALAPYLKTKREDRSLKGLLYLWKRSVWQTVVLVVVLGPVAEEIIFRFLGISLLSYLFTGALPLILTSILFGLAHNQYPLNLISGILGFILALVFTVYGLPAAIIAHATHNAVSLFYLNVKARRLMGISLTKALKTLEVNEVMKKLGQLN